MGKCSGRPVTNTNRLKKEKCLDDKGVNGYMLLSLGLCSPLNNMMKNSQRNQNPKDLMFSAESSVRLTQPETLLALVCLRITAVDGIGGGSAPS